MRGDVRVEGNVSAVSKSFEIEHPSKKGWKLKYGVLEGPEHAVYIRGVLKVTGDTSAIIDLPYYWVDLVDLDTITTYLTPMGHYQKLYVDRVEDSKIYIISDDNSGEINTSFLIMAERKDIDKLKTEYQENNDS